ncbi:hypothetical protein [Parasedimentitalea psychrophila]|uniref:Uncharacterized protein n=1 Tax=Parasedimentitalea psychrophila TaxID=2997337 RepID=A0A9Y2KVW0_9RHOB|nr:hypothetical protein [Parasedimentitalea psychrophila]WIY23499.1 hypothetical protein QPJ95_12605 [Parasedimentitalea psychrophila]
MSDNFPPFEFLGFANTLRDSLGDEEANVEKEFQVSEGHLITAFDLSLSACGSVISRDAACLRSQILLDDQRRAAIQTAMLQIAPLTFSLIVKGHYIAASTLVRQSIEGIEALRGIRQNRQKDGETPRLKALRHIGKLYGQLSGIAHLSKHNLLSTLLGNIPFKIEPVFSKDTARLLAGVHIQTSIFLALDMAEMVPYSPTEFLSPDEGNACSSSLGILVAEGILAFKNQDETSTAHPSA